MKSFTFDYRGSDSPFIDFIWHTTSEGSGSFTSSATTQWEMVVTKYAGKTTLGIRGPETIATPAPIPEDAEFFGMAFKLGAFMPVLPVESLVDGGITLPETVGGGFWLNGSTWEMPTFENADVFLKRLHRESLLSHEPLVEQTLNDIETYFSTRSIQRRFLRATGLTLAVVKQIERAREAANLLQTGYSILDTVERTGYSDQPHLTRSLKRFVGHTPAQIRDGFTNANIFEEATA